MPYGFFSCITITSNQYLTLQIITYLIAAHHQAQE